MNRLPAEFLLIGVEGGGTKTLAWIAARNAPGALEILGRGTGGPSNIHAVGPKNALDQLERALQEAWRNTQRSPRPAAAATLIMAGVDRQEEETLLTEWAISQQLAERVSVVNDSVGLLAAGTRDGWGVALIAGTGSIAFGQTANGMTTRTGGWGYLLGDEGSGYGVAIAGLRAAVRAADGRGPATRLLADFLQRFELSRPEDLLEAMYLSPRDRAYLASLADVVTTAAEAGDAVAREILDDAARELALLVASTARKLNIDQAPFPFCFTGGLLLNTPELERRLLQQLAALNLQLSESVAVAEPIWGAMKLAEKLLANDPEPMPS